MTKNQNTRKRVKVILNEEFLGMNSGWPTRYIGIIRELEKQYDLFVYAPGNTINLKETLSAAWVSPSQEITRAKPQGNLYQFLSSLFKPSKRSILRSDFIFQHEFYRVVNNDSRIYDATIYFGIAACIMYHESSDSNVICDFCDSRTRELKSRRRYSPIKNIPGLLLEAVYIRRIKKLLMPSSVTGLAITQEDAQEIQRSFRGQMLVVKNGIRTDHPKTPDEIRRAYDSKRILFVGSLDFGPNVHAVEAILGAIWPVACACEPALELDIVGRNPSADMEGTAKSSSNVKLHKNVPSTEPYYKRAMFLITPIYFGAGMKNKILEALAVGTPVITTKEAAKGIDLEENVHCFFADDNSQFIACLKSLERLDFSTYFSMSMACIDLAARYGWTDAVKPLTTLIDQYSSASEAVQ